MKQKQIITYWSTAGTKSGSWIQYACVILLGTFLVGITATSHYVTVFHDRFVALVAFCKSTIAGLNSGTSLYTNFTMLKSASNLTFKLKTFTILQVTLLFIIRKIYNILTITFFWGLTCFCLCRLTSAVSSTISWFRVVTSSNTCNNSLAITLAPWTPSAPFSCKIYKIHECILQLIGLAYLQAKSIHANA